MTVLEVAHLTIKAGEEEAFVNSAQGAAKILADDSGCRAVELIQGIEQSDAFLFVIEWDSVEAHETFRATEQFQLFRTAIGKYFAGPSSFAHYNRRIVLREGDS
ncbi:putative quinol monooxygenase [Pseudonocardia sp. T1-2H]|jgi:quinol monooxygenase YgiN|uniref:putative quinol monooxygenase n=1 Tax=Pseudonocardia sp. T1-2H TaxID=3128899 RepID=UPI0031014E9F